MAKLSKQKITTKNGLTLKKMNAVVTRFFAPCVWVVCAGWHQGKPGPTLRVSVYG